MLGGCRSIQMGEAGTITNVELAILCDIVSGWSMKRLRASPWTKEWRLIV